MNLRSIWFELFLVHATSSTCPNDTIPWTDDFCKPIDDAVDDATTFLLKICLTLINQTQQPYLMEAL